MQAPRPCWIRPAGAAPLAPPRGHERVDGAPRPRLPFERETPNPCETTMHRNRTTTATTTTRLSTRGGGGVRVR